MIKITDSMPDKFDLKIIHLLQKNSRTSYAEIGRQINLSASSVRDRVQHLTDSGLIKKFGIELDYAQLGYSLEAFILIKLFSGKLKNFLSIINKFEEVQQSFRITGNQNVHLKIILKDKKHLQDFLDKIMVYGDTTTYLILSEINVKNSD